MTDHATGPRTDAGKDRSSLNAIKHGLRSERPVLPGEDADEWDAFLSAIVADLDPANTLERELAERAALQLWRLRRTARYEAQVAADDCERTRRQAQHAALRGDGPGEQELTQAFQSVKEWTDRLGVAEAIRGLAGQLPTLKDRAPVDAELAHGLLLVSGCLRSELDEAPHTAGALRRELAHETQLVEAQALAQAQRFAEERSRETAMAAANAGIRLETLRRRQERGREARQHESRLLRASALDKVVRYEAHVSRQLNQALQLLRQFKNERRARDEEERAAADEPLAVAAEAPTPSSFGTSPEAAPSVTPRRESRDAAAGSADEPCAEEFVRPFSPQPCGKVCACAEDARGGRFPTEPRHPPLDEPEA